MAIARRIRCHGSGRGGGLPRPTSSARGPRCAPFVLDGRVATRTRAARAVAFCLLGRRLLDASAATAAARRARAGGRRGAARRTCATARIAFLRRARGGAVRRADRGRRAIRPHRGASSIARPNACPAWSRRAPQVAADRTATRRRTRTATRSTRGCSCPTSSANRGRARTWCTRCCGRAASRSSCSRSSSARARSRSGATTVERRGTLGYLWHGNPRFLNAEDDSTTSTLEIGVGPDPARPANRGRRAARQDGRARQVRRAARVQRGHQPDAPVPWPDLLRGFFIVRDMGFVHKMYRGLAEPSSGRMRSKTTRKAVDRGRRDVRHRRRLPVAAGHGPRAGRTVVASSTSRRARKASFRACRTCACGASSATVLARQAILFERAVSAPTAPRVS